jgi:hypothetical protein
MPHWEKRSLPLLNHSLDTFQKRVDAEAAEDPPFGTPLVRAGTVLFAPVQNFLHAGVSAGGHVCDLTGLKERLVVLFTLVPTPLLGVFLAHKELSLESPWGLKGPVTEEDLEVWEAARARNRGNVGKAEAKFVVRTRTRFSHRHMTQRVTQTVCSWRYEHRGASRLHRTRRQQMGFLRSAPELQSGPSRLLRGLSLRVPPPPPRPPPPKPPPPKPPQPPPPKPPAALQPPPPKAPPHTPAPLPSTPPPPPLPSQHQAPRPPASLPWRLLPQKTRWRRRARGEDGRSKTR